jgi:hypothetical protein
MTESEWNQAPDPHRMIQYIDGSASDRKLRLFACACCRRIWDLIEGELHRRAVEIAERFADGTGRVVEWEKGEGKGRHLRFRNMIKEPEKAGESVEREALLRELEEDRNGLSEEARICRYQQISPEVTAEWTLELRCDMAWTVADFASRLRAAPIHYWKQPFNAPVFKEPDVSSFKQARRGEMTVQAAFLRDIIGNPFRPVALERGWLIHQVVTLARAIYEDRAFSQMPTLGLALEEAGCGSADILAHCRSPSEHVRGCWVVDAILGKS